MQLLIIITKALIAGNLVVLLFDILEAVYLTLKRKSHE